MCKKILHSQPLPTSPTVSLATLRGHLGSSLAELLSGLQTLPRLAHRSLRFSPSLCLEFPLPCVLYDFSPNPKTQLKAFLVN